MQTLKDMKMFVKSDELNKHDAKIKAEYENGQKITIDIQSLTERTSKIKIRVGVIGDQNKSQMILSEIERYL